MKTIIKSLALVCLFFMPVQLFAENNLTTINFKVILRDDIKSCRYHIDDIEGNNWIYLDIENPKIQLITSDKTKNIIHYQYSIDNTIWHSGYSISYNKETKTWESKKEKIINNETTSIEVHDEKKSIENINSNTKKNKTNKISVGGTYIIPSINTSENLYDYGYGGNVRFDNSNNELDLYGEFTYWYGSSNNALIDSIHTGLFGLGLGYKLDYDFISIIPELGAGLLVEIPIHNTNGAIYCFDAFGEIGLCISSKVNKETQLFVRGNALAFSGTDEIALETALTAGTSILL